MQINWLAPFWGLLFGLVLGYFVSRRSAAEKPVRGGAAAMVFHYLGASLFVSTGPSVLVGAIFYRMPFLSLLALAFGMMALAFICLTIMAALEPTTKPA